MTSPQGTTWNSRRGHCSSAVFPAKTQRRPTHPPPECPTGGEGTDPQLGQNPKQTLQLKEPMGYTVTWGTLSSGPIKLGPEKMTKKGQRARLIPSDPPTSHEAW